MGQFVDWCTDHGFFGFILLVWAVLVAFVVFFLVPIFGGLWLVTAHPKYTKLQTDEWSCVATFRQFVPATPVGKTWISEHYEDACSTYKLKAAQ